MYPPISFLVQYNTHSRDKKNEHKLLRGVIAEPLESLRKPRRQRKRHETQGLVGRTMAEHVRCKSS